MTDLWYIFNICSVTESVVGHLVIIDFAFRSPLMIAAGNGQIGMLRMLLQFNADISLKDTKGWSAENYAVVNGHHP